MSVRLDHGEDKPLRVHEINVTPFIDVMLVPAHHLYGGGPARHGRHCREPADLERAERQPRPDKPIFLTVEGGPLTLGAGR